MYSPNSEDKARTNGYGRHNPDATSRPTFYMSEELLRAIQIQAQRERNSRSGFISGLLGFLLLSPIGKQLRENAYSNNRTLAQELEQTLALLQQQIPIEQIDQLAGTSQRSQIEMLTHLVLLGLQTYSRE